MNGPIWEIIVPEERFCLILNSSSFEGARRFHSSAKGEADFTKLIDFPPITRGIFVCCLLKLIFAEKCFPLNSTRPSLVRAYMTFNPSKNCSFLVLNPGIQIRKLCIHLHTIPSLIPVEVFLARRAGFLNPIGETRGPNFIVVVDAAIAPRVVQHSGESIPLFPEVGRRWSERRI